MESKFCTQCNIEKHINNFHKKFSECKNCNIKRGVRRYYDNKDKTSMQQKIYDEKYTDNLLQKHNDYSKKEAQKIKKYIDPMLYYKEK